MDEALARRLEDIETRLRAIEASLTPVAASPPPPPAVPMADWRGELDERGAVVMPEAMPVSPPPLPRPKAGGFQFDRSTGEPPAPVPAVPQPPPLLDRAPPKRPHAFDFESVVGLKLAGWVGAIVLAIGAALGVKFAYDQGWFGGLSADARCGLIAAAGAGLVALGEVVYRRVNRLAATGFLGAGVVVLYLAVFAGQAWYGLYGPTAAVGLLACVAGVGMAAAARADFVSVAAVAVLGAVLCPAFTGVLDDRPAGFRIYLLAVEAMSVGLCAWRATPKWWTLRGLTLAATAFDLAVGETQPASVGFILPGVIYALASATIYQGELIFTTWRRPRNQHGQPVVGTTFSLCVTAVMAVMLLAYQGKQPQWVRGETLVWTALAAVTTGLLIARRSVGLTILGRGFYVQAILLLTLAVPVSLDGPERLFGWMTLAVGLAALAYANGDDLAAGGATAVWLLTAAMMAGWADDTAASRVAWLHVLGEPVAAVTVVAAALTVAGHGVAFVLHRFFALPASPPGGRVDATIGLVLDFAAAAVLCITLLVCQPGPFATWAGLAYGLALWAVSLALLHLQPVAALILVATAMKWAVADVLQPRLAYDWKPVGRPFLNAQAAAGGALAAAFAVTGLVDRRRALADGGRRGPADTLWTFVVTATVAVIGVVLTAGTDSTLALRRAAGGLPNWPHDSADQLWRTAVLAVCLAAWLLVLRRTLFAMPWRRHVTGVARVLAYVLAAKFVVVDVMMPAMADAPPTPTPVVNLQTGTAVGLIALLALVGRRGRDIPGDGNAGLAALALLLVAGSAEIDRYAVGQSVGPVWIVRQVGWSIYWGVLAVAALGVGFALRATRLRVAALCLLAVTLLKLVVIDMAGVGTGWRILSFLGLGALLMLTSVLYGRFRRPAS